MQFWHDILYTKTHCTEHREKPQNKKVSKLMGWIFSRDSVAGKCGCVICRVWSPCSFMTTSITLLYGYKANWNTAVSGGIQFTYVEGDLSHNDTTSS